MGHRHETPQASDSGIYETGPIFADSSGQRRRLLRVFGAVASVMLVGALIMAGVGLFGGPDTPFSVFGAPVAHSHQHPAKVGGGGRHGAGRVAPGSVSTVPSGPAPTRSHRPSPSASADPSPTPTSTSSPAPTNKAGKTPPGLSHTHKPHPSPAPPG